MPKIQVKIEIEWDVPDDQFWLNADNVKTALSAYCKNTRFTVTELKESEDTTETTEGS